MTAKRLAAGASLLAATFAPPALAADLGVDRATFSPAVGRLGVTAELPRPARVGLRLADAEGTTVGWVVPPALRRALALRWDGKVAGAPVPDGRYQLELVRPGTRTLAATHVTVDRVKPRLVDLEAYSVGRVPFRGDRKLLTTISPNRDGLRDVAKVTFRLTEPAVVTFDVGRTQSAVEVVHTLTADLEAGRNTFTWFPPKTTAPRTYLVRLTVEDAAGNRREYGATNAETGRKPTAPVIRVLGVEAGFTRESYLPGDIAEMTVETDAPSLQVQLFRAGAESVPTYDDTVMNGEPVAEPFSVDWSGARSTRGRISVPVGVWASGLYFAKLTASDGRIGFAPFIVRAPLPGTGRVAVVLPTNTWQSYNFRDEDGNGWGDTWYAKGAQSWVRLKRPYLRRGVPPQYRKYDLGFLRWLLQTGKAPEYLAETDLEAFASGEALAAKYDLIVFPGHTEYVTRWEYDLVERFRDLGGNLAFLSANNFFWEVRRDGDVLRRTRRWRDQGRPEARVLGVQYRANDNGRLQRPFVVRSIGLAPWLFEGTGLAEGATFGQELGGYGIEIDTTTPDSPPGIAVLAEVPDLFGPGLTAQMAYYETEGGTKVFSAGAIDFGGTALLPTVSRMLENLWARLSAP